MKVMKIKRLLLIGLLLSASSLISAQEETISVSRFRLGIEAGITTAFDVTTNKLDNLRESQSYYYDDAYYNWGYNIRNFNLYYLGLKPEYTISKRFAVAAGLRFSFNPDELNSDKDYFLWKTKEDGLNTNFVKIRNISQKNIFVGVPLELKFFPREKDYFVRHYFILGSALNFLINSKTRILYENSEMGKYNSLISEQIGKPNSFQGYLYVGFGLKIGQTNHPLGNIEIHFPVYMFDNEKLSSFSGARETVAIGLQTTFQIPLCKGNKLKYKVDND
jgi:hypothetical protein